MVRAPRRLLFASILALGVAASAPAWAQGRADLEKARAAYLARNYAEAEDRLRVLTDPKTGVKELTLLSQARMYLGAVLLAQGKREQAVDVFEKLILEDPPFEPDPLGYPTDVVNTFIDVRVQLQERIRQAAQNAAKLEAETRARAEEEKRRYEKWLENVKQMAGEEKITVRHSRLVASLPFGAGQFQNGDHILGWTFLATEALLVVGTAVTVPMKVYARTRAEEEASAGDLQGKADLYDRRADDIRTVNLGLAGAFAAIAVAGIVQANFAYVPERSETKKRELPPLGKITPVLGPSASGGFYVGLTGATF
jgi:tetratricopeptide (TPR) repeat protein